MKRLFIARHRCCSSHKAFSTIKNICAVSGCMLCRQPACLNQTGITNVSTFTSTNSFDQKLFDKSSQFLCDRCGFKLRTQKCLDCHVSSRICHLYTVFPSCTVKQHCLIVCTVFPLFFPVPHFKRNCPNLAEQQCFVTNPLTHTNRAVASENPACILQCFNDVVERAAGRQPVNLNNFALNAPKNLETSEKEAKQIYDFNKSRSFACSQKPLRHQFWVLEFKTNQGCFN